MDIAINSPIDAIPAKASRMDGVTSNMQDTQFPGFFQRLPPVFNTELLIDALEVRFDSEWRNGEFFSDLLVLETLGQQFQDIQFPVGQRLYPVSYTHLTLPTN